MPKWLQDRPPTLWTLNALFVGFKFWLAVDALVVAAFLVTGRFSR